MKTGWSSFIFLSLLIAFYVWFLGAFALDHYGTLHTDEESLLEKNQSTKAIIVAGHWIVCPSTSSFVKMIWRFLRFIEEETGLIEQCQLGPPFKMRVRKGAELFWSVDKRYPVEKSLMTFTGANGESNNASYYAQAKFGIPYEWTVTENRSTTTMENAKYAFQVLHKEHHFNGTQPIVVVSDTYHLLRCKLLFSKYFGKENVQVLGSYSDPHNRIVGSLREVGAVAKNLLEGHFSLYEVVSELISGLPVDIS